MYAFKLQHPGSAQENNFNKMPVCRWKDTGLISVQVLLKNVSQTLNEVTEMRIKKIVTASKYRVTDLYVWKEMMKNTLSRVHNVTATHSDKNRSQREILKTHSNDLGHEGLGSGSHTLGIVGPAGVRHWTDEPLTVRHALPGRVA